MMHARTPDGGKRPLTSEEKRDLARVILIGMGLYGAAAFLILSAVF